MLNLNFEPVLDEFSILPDLGHIKLATEISLQIIEVPKIQDHTSTAILTN